jgi:hypothetical protein
MGRGSTHKPANENDMAPRPVERWIERQAIDSTERQEQSMNLMQ